MKILIVDDDSVKAAVIINAIRDIPGLEEDDIQISLDLNDARQRLRSVLYDLLILDLHISDRIGGTPKAEIGIGFITEICSTQGFYIPLDIVALTAYKEAKNEFSSNTGLIGFTILEYDQLREEWKHFLVSRIQYLLQCNQQRKISRRLYEPDVLWLTTVEVETDAVKETYDWRPYRVNNDVSLYSITEQECAGKEIKIVHVQLPEMGMASAASITAKGIFHFNPKYILMTGIAAGLDESLKPGDVMISSNVWNYDSGKYEECIDEKGDKKTIWKPDGKTISLQFDLVEKIKLFAGIEKKKVESKVGLFACGSAVVASQSKVQADVKAHFRKTIAIDMESYGVLLAAQISMTPEIPAIIIKGVSDKGDMNKDDSAQRKAAKNSTLVAKDLIADLFSNET